MGLARRDRPGGAGDHRVCEVTLGIAGAERHIGRPVLATTDTGAVVWSATWYPFGGVRVTQGTPIALRFPGQWFQTESGLHQNWMRDYDPTTGRYLQPDPLGLIDGPGVYGYALQSPMRWTDPRGEFGVAGAIIGAGVNLTTQIATNLYYYRDLRRAWICVDWWDTFVAGVWGAAGLGPWALYKSGQVRHIPASFGISKVFQVRIQIRRGDDQCCQIPPERRINPQVEEFLRGFFL